MGQRRNQKWNKKKKNLENSKNRNTKCNRWHKSSSKRDVYSDKHLQWDKNGRSHKSHFVFQGTKSKTLN